MARELAATCGEISSELFEFLFQPSSLRWKISPGQFSPNVQILSNFLRVVFRDNFTFQTFSTSLFLCSLLIFHCPTDKGLNTAPLLLFSILSTLVKFQIRCCPTIFKCYFAPHGAFDKFGGKGCRNDCNSFQRHSSNTRSTTFQVVVEEIAYYL